MAMFPRRKSNMKPFSNHLSKDVTRSLRKSFEPTRLLRQVRHRSPRDSAFAFVLIHP
jgi:hypothetical protein